MGLYPMLFGGAQLLHEHPAWWAPLPEPVTCAMLVPRVCGLGLGTCFSRIDVGRSDGMSFPG